MEKEKDKKDKWVEVITKLILLTQRAEIKWASVPPPETLIGKDRYADIIFTTRFKNKNLRLYELNYEIKKPDPLNMLANLSIAPKEYPFWTSIIILEIVDAWDHPLWQFPYDSALRDLLSSVKYQVAGVDSFLDDLLKND
jgi:hypothetical protein